MSEFTQAARIWSGNLGLHLDHYPSGKWGFVGSVPCVLAYKYKETGLPISDTDAKDIRQFGPGLIMKSRGIQICAWETAEAALEAAKTAGFEVRQ